MTADPPALVWDASALRHAARADRIDVLADLAKPWSNITTAAVIEELSVYGLDTTATESGWLRVVHVDGLHELIALSRWVQRVGATHAHDRGEATVLAWADAHTATALIDDNDARLIAQRNGLDAHGTLWLMAQAVRDRRVGERAIAGLLGTLRAHGARYPHGVDSAGWMTWARARGLLDPGC